VKKDDYELHEEFGDNQAHNESSNGATGTVPGETGKEVIDRLCCFFGIDADSAAASIRMLSDENATVPGNT